jgi:hypothetical protein
VERWNLEGGGTLTLRQEGANVRCEAERSQDGAGLYKVWLRGSRGGKFLLGTLAPEGERLGLRRTVPLRELERCGCWPVERAEAVLAFSFRKSGWYCEQHPERHVKGNTLRGSLPSPMLCRKGEGRVYLAAPFQTDSPVAVPELFCLAHLERLEGRQYLVWAFDEEGWPVNCKNFGNNL